MTAADVEAFTRMLWYLCAIYGREKDPMLVRGYFEALADLPFAALEAAALTWQRTQKFFPTPAELREATVPARKWLAGHAAYKPGRLALPGRTG